MSSKARSRSRAASDSGKKRKIPPGTKVLKEGMLMKMGAVHKAWQARYMVLRGGVWEYYSDANAWKDGKDPKGQLAVAEAKAARSKELEAEKKFGLAFSPVGTDRTYLFMCASFDDQQQWLTALNEAIAAEPAGNVGALKPGLSVRPRQASHQPREFSNPDIDIEDWLMRKGNGIGGVGLKSWTKRYFRLTSFTFSMYKNDKDSKPLSVTSVGNMDNVDYFSNKREGNRFDVLSHDEYGSNLTCLYATDAKAARNWCSRLRRAMDEWEHTKEKQRSKLVFNPGQNQNELNLSLNRSRSASESAGKDEPEDFEGQGGNENVEEVMAQLGNLDDLEEPAEDPPEPEPEPEPNEPDEEQKILRERQMAETGVEGEVAEHSQSRRKTTQFRMMSKREELERAIKALEEDDSDDGFALEMHVTEEPTDVEPENRAFPDFRLPSLSEILSLLGMADYLAEFQKSRLSSFDLLRINAVELGAIVRPKGPRGRLTRYLQPFINARIEAETAGHLRQLERSLERIGAELARVGTSVAHLNEFVPTAA